MIESARLDEAFPALRHDPSFRSAVELGLTCLRDLLEASVTLTSYHTTLLANDIVVLDTRATPSVFPEGLDFDFEHDALGRVRLRLSSANDNPISLDSSAALTAYAGSIFALFIRLFEGQVLARNASMALAHDLSHQLLSIDLLTTDLREREDLKSAEVPASRKEALRLLQAQSQLALYFVRKFMAATFPERQQFGQPEINELGEILADMVRLFSAQLKQRGLSIDLYGSTGRGLRVRGNESELRLAIFIVLENAIKYAAKGTRISVKLLSPYDPNPERRRIGVRIENLGIPIAPDEVSEVFRLGYRGRAAAALVPAGIGSGLTAAERIMHSLDGFVRLTSRPVDRAQREPQSLTSVDLVFPDPEA